MTRDAAKGNSVRAVTSNQPDLHEKLDATVRKHLTSEFLRPIADHNQRAFNTAQNWLREQNRPLILDSYCGTGESTAWLAAQHPDCAVIGIDKSRARLDKHQGAGDNYMLARADTDDFWRLALEAGWQAQSHHIFYPNPWPKSEHLKRRCHGSPLFPTLLALGGNIELRTNWRIYAEEFCAALAIAGFTSRTARLRIEQPVTAFERKYSDAGQTLWQVEGNLSSRPDAAL